MNLSERLLEIAEEKKLIKPKDLIAEKIPTVYLSRLVKQGKLLQVGKRLYSLPDRFFIKRAEGRKVCFADYKRKRISEWSKSFFFVA